MAATRGDEAAVPASSKAPRVAGKARRRGAFIVAMTSRLVRATNGFDCIDPLAVPLRDPVKGHLSGHTTVHGVASSTTQFESLQTVVVCCTGGRRRSAAITSSTWKCGFAVAAESRRMMSAIILLVSRSVAS